MQRDNVTYREFNLFLFLGDSVLLDLVLRDLVFQDIVRGHLLILGHLRDRIDVHPQPFLPIIGHIADVGEPDRPNPQLLRWHGVKTFHRPRDFAVVILSSDKVKVSPSVSTVGWKQ